MNRVALAVLCSLWIIAPAPARAETAEATRYAVISLEIEGDADPSLREQVEEGLVRGVANAGADLIGLDALGEQLAGKPALVGCDSPTCLAQIAEVIGTAEMLRVAVTADGANFELALELVDATGARASRRRVASCIVCTTADLAQLAEARVYDLLTAAAGAPVDVTITTRPDGASLDIPEQGTLTAPWNGKLAPGDYAVAASLRGYRSARKQLTVVDDGTDQRFEIVLEPEAGRPRWIKWAAAGGSAALLVTGLVLLGLDGNQTCDAPDATCPREYATGTGGAVLGVIGLAGGAAAGWMFWKGDF